MSSKTAVYDILRSADGGLKLPNIDPSTCGIRNLMMAALEEIDPSSYRGARQRFGEANRLDLGNILCSEIDKRSTQSFGPPSSDPGRHWMCHEDRIFTVSFSNTTAAAPDFQGSSIESGFVGAENQSSSTSRKKGIRQNLGRAARKILWFLLGVLSLISGAAILLWPVGMAGIYGLPRGRFVLQLIGARDVVIGAGLLASFSIRWFLWSRSLSEAIDAVLIGIEGIRTGQYWSAVWRITIALLTSGLAWTLARTIPKDRRNSPSEMAEGTSRWIQVLLFDFDSNQDCLRQRFAVPVVEGLAFMHQDAGPRSHPFACRRGDFLRIGVTNNVCKSHG